MGKKFGWENGNPNLMVMPSKLWRFEWSGGGTVKEKIEEIKSILFNESLFAFFLHLYYYFKEPSGLDHE